MSLDTVPETLTRMRAQLTALAMEKQALLEDIAVGNLTHGERLAAIEQDEVRSFSSWPYCASRSSSSRIMRTSSCSMAARRSPWVNGKRSTARS